MLKIDKNKITTLFIITIAISLPVWYSIIRKREETSTRRKALKVVSKGGRQLDKAVRLRKVHLHPFKKNKNQGLTKDLKHDIIKSEREKERKLK